MTPTVEAPAMQMAVGLNGGEIAARPPEPSPVVTEMPLGAGVIEKVVYDHSGRLVHDNNRVNPKNLLADGFKDGLTMVSTTDSFASSTVTATASGLKTDDVNNDDI